MTDLVRTANEMDSNDVVRLLMEFAQEEHWPSIDSQAVTKALRLCIGREDTVLFVAEEDGDVIGYIAIHWIPFPMLGGTECYISDLFVRRKRRGSGVGRRLMQAAEQRASELGCVRLMLNNRVAAESFKRAFYVNLGFRIRDEFANMVKSLPQSN